MVQSRAGCSRGSVRALLLAVVLLFAACSPALAQTDEIQVYDATIAPTGVFNLTWHNNYTPGGQTQPGFPGGIVPEHALNGVPEWAYGVTPWMEAGLYLPLYSVTGDGAVRVNGFKLRALFVRPDAAEQPSSTASTSSSAITPRIGTNTATARRSGLSSAGMSGGWM